MAAKRSGFVWHMYHKQLMSWCYDYDYRVRDIMTIKPVSERPVRLRRFQFVKGKLPDVFGGPLDNSRVSWFVRQHQEEIDALHAEECKDCSWNGAELLFRKQHWLRRFWTWLRVEWSLRKHR